MPAYAEATADVEPTRSAGAPGGRLTTPEAETVSAAEFEQMKRDLDLEDELRGAHGAPVQSKPSWRSHPYR